MRPDSLRKRPRPQRHRPGHLVRVRVWNFTTYAFGEFALSPTLNMIIGPNGTGKSTLVAAVCLGLGGKVDMIRRKSLDSMIKSGESESTIEVTLKNLDGLPDVVIERKLTLRLTKSKWRVSGNVALADHVRQLVRGFGIQLDNLCHFLPQERVAEFASLSPEKLLVETERTIGDSTLLQKHMALAELDEERVAVASTLNGLSDRVRTLAADVEKFEHEARKFQEYEHKVREIALHRKLLPFAKLHELKEQLKDLKKTRADAKAELQKFAAKMQPLQRGAESALQKRETAAAEVAAVRLRVEALRRDLDAAAAATHDAALDIASLKAERDSVLNRADGLKKDVQKAKDDLRDRSARLAALPPVDERLLASLLSRRQEEHDEKIRLEDEIDSAKFELETVARNIERKHTLFKEEKRRLESNDRIEVLNMPSGHFTASLTQSAYKAHTFLRRIRREKQLRYFECPVVSCHVTDHKYAKYVEKVIDNNSLFALFFENEAAYSHVSALLPREINAPMRVMARGEPAVPVLTSDQLQKLGFDGYLSDFVRGPEHLVNALKRSAQLDVIPVATRPIKPEVIERFLKPGSSGKVPFFKFIVENSLFKVSRSNFGSRQLFYSTEHIHEAQIMGSEGLTPDMKRSIVNTMTLLKREIEKLQEGEGPVKERQKTCREAILEVGERLKDLDEQVVALRKKKDARLKVEDTVKHLELKIARLERAMNEDHTEHVAEAESRLLDAFLAQASALGNLASLYDKVAAAVVELKCAEVYVAQAENRVVGHQTLAKGLEEKRAALQNVYEQAKQQYNAYKSSDAAKEIQNQNLTPEEREQVKELAERYLSEDHLSEAYILARIGHLEDDISVLAHADSGSMELLKEKRAQLENANRELPLVSKRHELLGERIESILGPWLRDLSEAVAKVSAAFRKRFVLVASDGEVRLVKSERFRNWKLEIMVKFRENSELKVLDHQLQSGGERAVSTIFFIMSLQGLTHAPIRIVDEINQGMDPKNEKLSHKYLVHTACRKGSSQYFLVTPKLLTGLYYHPEMAIHCIFTGPLLDSKADLGMRKLEL